MARSFRHQLPAYSPISLSSLAGAVVSAAIGASDELQRARELLSARFDADDVVLVDSGRSALQLAIRAAVSRIDPHNRVVALPSYSCYEVATAAVGADARFALYDLDPATLSPNIESLEEQLRHGARVVVIAPLYGFPVDWDRVVDLLGRYEAFVIEDAAQSNGAEWRGTRLGSFGEMSVVSFGRGKGWTGGGGGALLLRGRRAQYFVSSLGEAAPNSTSRGVKALVTTTVQWVAGRPSIYGLPASIPSLGLGETIYHEPSPVRGASVFSASLVQKTLKFASREVLARRASAARWLAEMPRDASAAVPRVIDGGTPGYMRLPILVAAERRELLDDTAARRLGFVASYPKSLVELPPVAERLAWETSDRASAARLAREVMTLPTHSRLSDHDRAELRALLERLFA